MSLLNLGFFRAHMRRHGIFATLHFCASKLANRMFHYLSLRCMSISLADLEPSVLENSFGFEGRFLRPRALAEFSSNPEYRLSDDLIAASLLKVDECYGIMDGDVLASYGWCSRKPTVLTDELIVRFDPAYVYLYAAFTHPSYRGKRCQALKTALALREFTERGSKGMIAYVESTNFASLKSCYRMGYKKFGVVRAIKLFGRYFIHHSEGCTSFQFRVVPGILAPNGRLAASGTNLRQLIEE